MPVGLERVRQAFVRNHVFETLQPVLVLSFVCGLTPIRVRLHANGGGSDAHISALGLCIIAAYIALYGVCYVLSLWQGESVVRYFFRTDISVVGDTLQLCNGLVTGTVIYASGIVQRHKLLRTLRILDSLDRNFANIGIRVKYSRIFRFAVALIAFKLLVILVYLVGVFHLLKSINKMPSFCVCVSFFLQHSMLSVTICVFRLITRSFERRLVILNQVHRGRLMNARRWAWARSVMLQISHSADAERANGIDAAAGAGVAAAGEDCQRSERHPLRSWLRELFTAREMCDCLRPLFLVTFCHGLTPFYIGRRKRGGRTGTHHPLIGYVNCALHIFFYVICYILTLFNGCESIAGYFFRSHITHVGDFMQILSGLIGVIVIYFSSMLPKQRLQKQLSRMQALDRQLQGVGVKILYSNVLRFCYAYFALTTIVNSAYVCGSLALLHSATVRPSTALHFTFILQHSVISTVIIMFACTTKALRMRLIMLNKVLKNLSHQWDNSNSSRGDHKPLTQKNRSLQCLDSFSMYNIVTKNPSDIIQESMDIHYLICDAASTANKYFTYQLLTIISIAFLIIVFDAYYVLETLLGKSRRESKFKTLEFVTFFSCQMILYLIAIISIVEGSNRTIRKSEKTGSLVHALLNKAKTAELKEKLTQFSMQLTHLKINFTAAGLFTIDRTLYFTISGALTTYLIILLQFTSNSPQAMASFCKDTANASAVSSNASAAAPLSVANFSANSTGL